MLHGVLFYCLDGQYRVFVPSSLRNELVSEFHDLPVAGHFGWRKMYDALYQHYYCPHMELFVRAFVKKCPVCQLT